MVNVLQNPPAEHVKLRIRYLILRMSAEGQFRNLIYKIRTKTSILYPETADSLGMPPELNMLRTIMQNVILY